MSAESNYYTPRESSEWEVEVSTYTYCSNEDCADFEQAVEMDILYSMYGLYGEGDWTCPTCGTEQTSTREFDHDYFIDPDAGRDDY